MPPRRETQAIHTNIINDLNVLSYFVGKFLLRTLNGRPQSVEPVDLDPSQSLIWSGNLAQALSDVTGKFRDNLIIAEPVPEAIRWPDPLPIKDDPPLDDGNLWETIDMTVSMERETFRMITERYYGFARQKWHRVTLLTVHDLLNEILQNTNTFILAANRTLPMERDPVAVPDPPSPSSPSCEPNQRPLVTLEHGIRRYLEVHMQIATLIPAHLRIPPTRKF